MKEQEYLFYLMLTYLGCDVFLIQNRDDVKTSSALLKYSFVLKMGERGNSVIISYVKKEPPKPQKKDMPSKATVSERQNKKVVIPERPERTKAVTSAVIQSNTAITTAVQQASIINSVKSNTKVREEKS